MFPALLPITQLSQDIQLQIISTNTGAGRQISNSFILWPEMCTVNLTPYLRAVQSNKGPGHLDAKWLLTQSTIEICRLQERVQLRRQITDWSRCQQLLLCGHTATFGLRGVNNIVNIYKPQYRRGGALCSERINEQEDVSMGKRENT